MTYVGAHEALTFLFEGTVHHANAARNTKYINIVIAKMCERKNSFSIDDAKSVCEEIKD